MRTRPFVVWDGEGPQDTGYSLLGNSLGDEICYPHLRTKDCLNLLLRAAEDHPEAIHVAYGFNYDVSCILWELSWRHLTALYKFNRVIWRDYIIEHIPRKWFKVRRGNVVIKIYDIASFFGGGLVGALEEWKIGPFTTPAISSPQEIASGVIPTVQDMAILSETEIVTKFKHLRGDFKYSDIESIKIYMRLELKYTKILIGELRESLALANYVPKSWHGPGAVARMAFTRHSIYDCLADSPEPVAIATRYAFIAGRFELFKAGHIGRVYTADINSAYPYYCSQLPNLAKGIWRRTEGTFEPGKFGVYHIRYQSKPDAYRCNPLPFRDEHGMIAWPHQVIGWYWNPEAELVANDPDATFLEGWVFDEDDETDRPFAWLADYFDIRAKWKAEGNPAQYALKLIINSIYGQLAQRAGWDKKNNKAPKTHQLEYAGWITSSCRAAVYKVAKECGDNLVSIDTDGVTSTQPFTWLKDSKALGGWELTSYTDSIFWQSGIYTLKTADGWSKARTRGIPKGSYTVEDLFTALETDTPLYLNKKVFISFGLAILGQKSSLNQWKVEPHVYEMGGSGKRYHYKGGTKRTIRCPDICGTSGRHVLALPTIFYGIAPRHSAAHKLPWLNTRQEMEQKDLLTSLVIYDLNDLDPDDEWILEDEYA